MFTSPALMSHAHLWSQGDVTFGASASQARGLRSITARGRLWLCPLMTPGNLSQDAAAVTGLQPFPLTHAEQNCWVPNEHSARCCARRGAGSQDERNVPTHRAAV